MATLTRKKTSILWASLLLTALVVSASFAAVSTNEPMRSTKDRAASYRIRAVSWDQSDDDYILSIKGGSTPTYTMYELFEPLRVIIDIADSTLDSAVSLPIELSQSPVSVVNGKVIADKKPSFTRIELFLRADHNYTVDRVDNDILVKFPKSKSQVTDLNNSNTAASLNSKSEIATQNDVHTEEISSKDFKGEKSETTDGSIATKLVDIEITKSTNETKVLLKTDGVIRNFKKVLLGKNQAANRPDRMYLDLNNIRLIGGVQTISVDTAISKVRTAKRQDGIRVVFDSGLDKLFDYNIKKHPNGLMVTIIEPAKTDEINPNLMVSTENSAFELNPQIEKSRVSLPTAESDNLSGAEPTKPMITNSNLLPDNNSDEIDKLLAVKKPKPNSSQDLTFSGYTKQRITVDFYKIDLHNVFRLFGDISNINIVVDEAVNGSLTLALNDVPWDFALDIILNLKDLQKEERFNTIVISPKSKLFTWPERALDNVEFKSDIKIQQAELADGGIKINKRLEVPENVIAAKKLIHQANISERKGDFSTAISLYEDAFIKWNDNVNLAKRIAALCLVNAEQNAKAVHYAKTTLKLSPSDRDAALQAAIGLARMQRSVEAKDFFEMSVIGDNPSSEALTSFSSFCEEQLNYGCSLDQLKRHEDLHGDTLDTMVSKARIYDKQGKQDLAAQEYRTILLSGYELPADLQRYIKGRAALASR